MEKHVETSLIDGELNECVIIRVPSTCSVAQARDIEQRLTTELKANCIVVTKNIEFCQTDPVERSEIAHLLKDFEDSPEVLRTLNIGATVSEAMQSVREGTNE